MHLFLIGPDWQITARFRTEFVRDALAAGWRVTIAAGGQPGGDADGFRAMGVTCLGLPSRRNRIDPIEDLAMVGEVDRQCRRLKPDVALAFTVKPVTFGLIGAALARVPVRAAMITGAGYALTDGVELKRRIIRLFVSLLYRISLGLSHRVIFQNDDDLADFERLSLISPNLARTRINGSGVDLDRFAQAPLPDGPITFVMVARLLIEKGVREFVDAARQVKARFPDTRFVLVGPMDTNPTAITKAEIDGWVTEGILDYRGPQADVRPFLQDAHVFTLPSYREGTPRSALEALATGRPVLTVDVPGCREVVVDGVTGRMVQVRNSDAVAEAMTWFIANRSRLPEMSRQARADAESRFDVHGVNRTIMSALIETGPRSGAASNRPERPRRPPQSSSAGR